MPRDPSRPHPLARRAWAAALLAAALAGCALMNSAGGWFEDRPPAPLDRATTASDARIDSSGAMAGSFIGEGTSRQVHLLSSDTALIGALARRYQPARDRGSDVWQWLSLRRTFAVNIDPVADSTLSRQPMLVGSPDGHTSVRLSAILLHGSSCGWRGTQAEFLVEPAGGNGPSLRGPVVGSFRAPTDWGTDAPRDRRPPAPPGPGLTDSLLAWTGRTMDTVLAHVASGRDLPLARVAGRRLALNGLEDDDAADVLAFQVDDGSPRYAVSLRERMRTARGADALAAIVMVWDSAGRRPQVVFRPTLLEYHRGRPVRSLGAVSPALFWRRLDAVSGFAFGRDYLWMEQVDVEDGSVMWVILDPRSNTLVAAAEVAGPC